MKKKTIIVVLIILFIVVMKELVMAENLEELQQKKEEIQVKISQSNEQIEQIELELTENLEKLNELNQKILNYETEVENLETEISIKQQEIKTISDKLDILKTDYEQQKRTLETRLVALYEAGDTQYLDVLLSSHSVSEFISNYYLISEIASYDKDILDNIEREKKSIDTIKKNLEEQQNKLKTAKNTKEKTSIILENAKVVRNEYVNKLTEQELRTQSEIEVFQDELDKINAEILYLSTGNLDSSYVGGELAWPAPGYTTITSVYGMRIHPIFKIQRMHSGVDIGAPTGAIIVSANGGIVVKASYTAGYGNMVMIDHGGGISTVYGHGSEILVEVGQTVERGQPIMKAGSTGWSTGPHLHFEVRVNGSTIDPLPYITNQSKTEESSNNTNNIENETI